MPEKKKPSKLRNFAPPTLLSRTLTRSPSPPPSLASSSPPQGRGNGHLSPPDSRVTPSPIAPGPLGDTLGALRQATVVLELDHSFSVPGDGSAGRRQAAASSTIKLSLETVRRTLDSVGDGLPSLIPRDSTYSLPQLLQPSGSFETTFADESLRICRGGWPSNEIRVFERVPEAGAVAAADAKGSAEELSFEEELWCEDMNDFVPSD